MLSKMKRHQMQLFVVSVRFFIFHSDSIVWIFRYFDLSSKSFLYPKNQRTDTNKRQMEDMHNISIDSKVEGERANADSCKINK